MLEGAAAARELEPARALLAGLIAGVTAAFAVTAIALVALVHDARWRGRALNLRVPPALAGVIVVNGVLLAFTAVGLVLGALYLRAAARQPAGGFGSPNRLFTLAVAGTVLGVLLGATFVRGRLTRPMAAIALVALLAFGWLLPGLAG